MSADLIEAKLATLPEPDLSDPDNLEWTEVDFARARPAAEALPAAILAQFPKTRNRGRPPVAARKQHVSIRLSPSVLAYYRDLGKGWQAQVDHDLAKAIKARLRAPRREP